MALRGMRGCGAGIGLEAERLRRVAAEIKHEGRTVINAENRKKLYEQQFIQVIRRSFLL